MFSGSSSSWRVQVYIFLALVDNLCLDNMCQLIQKMEKEIYMASASKEGETTQFVIAWRHCFGLSYVDRRLWICTLWSKFICDWFDWEWFLWSLLDLSLVGIYLTFKIFIQLGLHDLFLQKVIFFFREILETVNQDFEWKCISRKISLSLIMCEDTVPARVMNTVLLLLFYFSEWTIWMIYSNLMK